MDPTCSIGTCSGVVYCKGWCRKHYTRWYRHGDPQAVEVIRGDDLARFRDSYEIDPITGCHLWTELLNHRGYAKFFAGGKTMGGHTWAWTQKNGPVPRGKQLDHFFCDTKLCVNADHVRPTTARENVLRSDSVSALNAAKEKCVNGHAFTAENTYLTKRGTRQCRQCVRDRKRRARQQVH